MFGFVQIEKWYKNKKKKKWLKQEQKKTEFSGRPSNMA